MDVQQKIANHEYDVTDRKLLASLSGVGYSKEQRKEARITYNNLMYIYRLQFKADLEEQFEVARHPKATKLFEMSWDRGHSSGYHEVYYEYDELAELLK